MKNQLVAQGCVSALAVNGDPVSELYFYADGPEGDTHAGFTRALSGHDGAYIRTSKLNRGDPVFNWRSWTGLSHEETLEIETGLGYIIPEGALLENVIFSGIPDFSKLAPATRLVFPERDVLGVPQQAILAVWEENGPCATIGKRLEEQLGVPKLCSRFVKSALHKRGLMGFVLSPGLIMHHDSVAVYPPVT